MAHDKMARLIGMACFLCIGLIVFWYWRVGYVEFVDLVGIRPLGWGSLLVSALSSFPLSTEGKTAIWLGSQLALTLLGWILREKLGRLVQTVYRKL